MQYGQSANAMHRGLALRNFIPMLIVLLACLFASRATMAQIKGFTAIPLTPESTISAPDKEAIVQSGEGAPRGSEFPGSKVASGFCDVAIAAGISPAGYLALSLFGIMPVPGVTDDSVTNFTVPAFTFAGQSYTKVGFSSNGYVIIGGSTVPADNAFINQNMPNPASPNNVLAPFWTDLDPPAGGALRIGVLTDGMDTWNVLDWEGVKEFGATRTHSFQVWIGINGDAHPAEDITFTYGPVGGAGAPGGLTVGAENKFGTRGQNFYFNGTGTLPVTGTQLRVTTTSCRTSRIAPILYQILN